MSDSAEQIARKALREEQRPVRQAVEDEQRRREAAELLVQERQRAIDTNRLEASPLKEWFPGVRWKPIAHGSYYTGTVYEEVPDQAPLGFRPLRLAVTDTNRVMFTPHEETIDRTDTRELVEKSAVTIPAIGERDLDRRDWVGYEVHSAADVGRQFRRVDAIYASMPADLP